MKRIISSRSRSQLFFCGFITTIFILTTQGTGVGAENFEFQLSNPMLITSLRHFDKVSEHFHVFRSRNGSIILRADPGHGIMAVVQEMNLQNRHQEFPSSSPSCLDYIRLSQVEGSGQGTGEICGNLESSSPGVLQDSPHFLDTSGWVELDYVVTEKSRISPLEAPITNFNISFTPFQECPEDAFPWGNGALRPCSILTTFSCISADFFCDGVVNCAFPHEFGLDEQNCPGSGVNNVPCPDGVVNCPPPEVLSPVGNDDQGDDEIPEILPKLPNENDSLWEDEDLNRVRVRIFHYGRQANAGIFATLTIFVILLGLIKMRRSRNGSGRSRLFQVLPQQSDPRDSSDPNTTVIMDKASGGGCGIESNYDPESDPVPSYEDCLRLLGNSDTTYSRPIYAPLSLTIEHERPPSYEEVRVHSWTQKLRF